MALYLNWNALLRYPLSREKRREFRRNPNNLPTRQQLLIANRSLQQAAFRSEELQAAIATLRIENAALAERAAAERVATAFDLKTELSQIAATAFDIKSALSQIAATAFDIKSALSQVALADTVGAQLTDARDRLASKLELLTSDVNDVRRRVDPAGRQEGSDETRRLYLDLLESTLTGVLTRDGNAAPWGTDEFDADRRHYGRDWPKTAVTMIGTARMRNLRRLVETTLAEGVTGDLLEAGAWRGGACIYMRGILAAHAVKDRTVWVAEFLRRVAEAR